MCVRARARALCACAHVCMCALGEWQWFPQNPQAPTPQARHATCQICFEDVDFLEDTTAAQFRRSCCSSGAFCGECLTTYTRLRVTERDVNGLMCPEAGCDKKMSARWVRGVLKNDPELASR